MTPRAGAIFDIDGVLVDSPHERAWREALRELMEGPWRDLRPRTTWSPEAFTPLVYQTLASGKPRVEGARSLLEHFHVADDGHEPRVNEYAARKQHEVERLITAGAFTAYPDGLRCVIRAKDAGLRIAAASSSKNATPMLGQIRLDTFADAAGIESPFVRPGLTLLDAFDVNVSGRDFAHGKPYPEMFLAAAAELGLAPASVVVVEDAPAGVRAAKAGGMVAVGIARADDEQLLRDAGADLVVTSLDDVELATLTPPR
jgi:beta-phosphoglucomutase-like phosphatase (HAD superfamily)